MSLRPEIQELLLRVSTGELSSDSAEFRQAFAHDPEARAEADEWLATVAGIEAVAAEEGRDEEEPSGPADLAQARAFLGARVPAAQRTFSVRGRRSWLVVSLCAAAVLVLWMFTPKEEPGKKPAVFLGQAKIELLTPLGSGASPAEFRWSPIDLPPLARYRLVVEGCDTELLRVDGLVHPGFTPDEAQRAHLSSCGAVRWSVFVVAGDGGDTILAWGSAEASLR